MKIGRRGERERERERDAERGGGGFEREGEGAWYLIFWLSVIAAPQNLEIVFSLEKSGFVMLRMLVISVCCSVL